MAYKPEMRVNPISHMPEHRHGVRNWHWAWSTHDGIDPIKDAQHKGIYKADPRTREQVKARVGYTATNAAIVKAGKAKAKVKVPRKARKATAIVESVEAAIDLINAN